MGKKPLEKVKADEKSNNNFKKLDDFLFNDDNEITEGSLEEITKYKNKTCENMFNNDNSDENLDYSSPIIINLPDDIDLRLIDVGMLYYEASISGYKERYDSGKTSHTIHVWWARRPHSAMRALIFASVCKKINRNMLDVLTELTFLNKDHHNVLEKARKELYNEYDRFPKLLDMFSGGGTIPFESLNLGIKAYSLDSNQLAVFNQTSMLIYSQKNDITKNLKLLESVGIKVLDRLNQYTDELFPLRKKLKKYKESLYLDEGSVQFDFPNSNLVGYLWTYSKICKKCGYKFYLIKRPWISKKKKKNLAFVVENNDLEQKLRIKKVSKDYEYPTVWKNSSISCPRCKKIEENVKITDCQDEIIALIFSQHGKGKRFVIPSVDPLPDLEKMEKYEEKILKDLNIRLPQTKIPKWSGITNPSLYGIKYHKDIFNKRQRIVLLSLIRSLYEEFIQLEKEQGKDTATYIISLLSALIDQLVDWNCRIAMWISQNEQVGRGFCGPGIPMYWDYVEIDPLLDGPANLWSKLKRILNGASNFVKFPVSAEIKQGIAQDLPFEDNFFDAIVTDPPYYDNIYYSILADFFYIWKAQLFKKIEPKHFTEDKTDWENELVASSYRHDDSTKAHENYCTQLTLAFNEAARVLKNDGIFSFIYSHSAINAWLALINAYRSSEFTITSVQPLSIERKQRPRAMTSNAVNTCIAFVARKFHIKKENNTPSSIKKKIELILDSNFVQNLLNSGWHDNDVALAVFANGVALLSNIQNEEENDEKILIDLVKLIKTRFKKFNVKKRKSL